MKNVKIAECTGRCPLNREAEDRALRLRNEWDIYSYHLREVSEKIARGDEISKHDGNLLSVAIYKIADSVHHVAQLWDNNSKPAAW